MKIERHNYKRKVIYLGFGSFGPWLIYFAFRDFTPWLTGSIVLRLKYNWISL